MEGPSSAHGKPKNERFPEQSPPVVPKDHQISVGEFDNAFRELHYSNNSDPMPEGAPRQEEPTKAPEPLFPDVSKEPVEAMTQLRARIQEMRGELHSDATLHENDRAALRRKISEASELLAGIARENPREHAAVISKNIEKRERDAMVSRLAEQETRDAAPNDFETSPLIEAREEANRRPASSFPSEDTVDWGGIEDDIAAKAREARGNSVEPATIEEVKPGQFLSTAEVDALLKKVDSPTDDWVIHPPTASAVPHEVPKAELMPQSEWMDNVSLGKPMMPSPVIGAPDNIPLDSEHESADPAPAGSGEERLSAEEMLPEGGEETLPIPLFPRMSRRTAPPPPAAPRSKEGETIGREAGGDARLDAEEGRRWLYGFLNSDKEMPKGFVVPEELREPAEVFLQRRDELLQSYGADAQGWSGWERIKNRARHAVGRSVRDGEVSARKDYDTAYKNFQESIVRGHKMRYEREGRTPEEVRERMLGYASQTLVQSIASNDMALERERMERMFGQHERGTMSKLWDSYQRIPRSYRIGISAALSGGAGVALASGAGVAVALGYGGYRVARTVAGGASAWGLQKAIDRFGIQKIFGRARDTALANQREFTKVGLEGIAVEDEANLSYLLGTINADARRYQGELKSIAKQEKTARIISGLVVGLGAGLAAGIAFRPSASEAVGLVEPNTTIPAAPFPEVSAARPHGDAGLSHDTTGSPKTSVVKPDSFSSQTKGRVDQSLGEKTPVGKPTPSSSKGDPLESPAPGKPRAAAAEEVGGSKSITVGKGEGLWHPVKRQLAEHLRANPQKYHFKPEDLQDAKKVDAFLNRRTQKILMDAGKTEMGVRKPGLHVLLDEHDKLQQVDNKELYHRAGGAHELSVHAKTHRGGGVDATHTRRARTGAGADNTPAGRDARKMVELMRQSEHSKEVLRQARVDADIAGGVADAEHAATIALEAQQAARKAAENYLEKLGFSPRERTAWLLNREKVTVGKVLKEIPEDYNIAKDGGASVDLPYQGVRRFGAVPRQIELARLMREAMKKSALRLDRFGNPPPAIRDMPIEKFLENIDPVTRKFNNVSSP